MQLTDVLQTPSKVQRNHKKCYLISCYKIKGRSEGGGEILLYYESCLLCVCMAIYELLNFEKHIFLIAFWFVGIKSTVQYGYGLLNPVCLLYCCFLL